MAPKKENKDSQDIEAIRKHGRWLIEDSITHPIPRNVLAKIEEGIWDSNSGQFSILIYSTLCVKIIESLKLESVQNGLRTGILKPQDLATLSRDELNPEKWQQLQEARLPKNKQERKKGIYKCPKCKSWYTTHTQIQTRSADEGLTTKVACECGHYWKFN